MTHLAFDDTTGFCWREQTAAAAAATATTTAGAAATTTAGAAATTTAGATMIAGAVSQHSSLLTPHPSWHAPRALALRFSLAFPLCLKRMS